MATELFSANRAATTVSSGGTDAPASGTSESWTVASSAMFGTAQTGISQFHVADPVAPSEIIAVTSVSGATWTVTRGAEGTTPVPHASGFAVYQVVTTGFLGAVASLASSAAVTVSPIGLSTGGVTAANNGAMFGPDTAATTTQGLQEAVTYAVGLVAGISSFTAPPALLLMPGDFTIASTITIPVPSGTGTNTVAFEIAGSGHIATRVKFSAGAGFAFGQYAWQDVVFRDLTIEAATGGTATSLISMVGSGASFPDLRSEMMFHHVWFELPSNPALLPSDGCIYFGASGGHTGGFDLYFTNSVIAGSFSITSPYNASFVNCLVASGSGVTITTTCGITTLNSSEITGQIVLSGTNLTLRADNSYWNQIPASAAVSCAATTGTTRVIVQKSTLNFLGSGAVVSQSASTVELHYGNDNAFVASSGTFTLVAGGCVLSHTSTYGGNYADGFYAGPGAAIQNTTLPTNPPVSNTTYQNTLGIALNLAVPITYNPTGGAAATCALNLGPVTPFGSAISTESYPAASTTGITTTLRFRVPAGWYYRVLATNATIGTATVLPEQ